MRMLKINFVVFLIDFILFQWLITTDPSKSHAYFLK